MSDDLVKQLREYGSCGMVFEAADRIEKLEAALREIIEGQWHLSIYWAADVAKDALAGEKMDG